VSAAPWDSGKSVGGYTLLASIAQGGMGEIWLARQSGPQAFERVVVVKRIVPDEEGDAGRQEMLLDEARISAQLNHPNIVQVYELGHFEGSFFIAMEYLHGENLSSVVRRSVTLGSTLPIACGVRVIAEAAEALAYAHAKKALDGTPLGLVHRDVSPQNIVVTYDGHMKLVDFGVAKARGRSSQTLAGTVKGKFAYMSPEQARGEPVDGRSDLFGLGVVLFEVLSHTRFYAEREAFMALQHVLQGAPLPRLQERAPQVPTALARIVDRCTARSPGDRYATARELAADLEGWLKTTQDGSATQIESWMRRAFEDRIAQREKLIASAGNVGPVLANDVMVKSDRSMPGNTTASTIFDRPMPLSPARPLRGLIAVAVVLVAAGAVLSRFVKRPQPSPVVVVEELVIDAGAAEPQIAAPPAPPAPLEAEAVVDAGPAMPIAPPAAATASAPRRAAPPPVAKGRLSLDTTPWTQVSLGKTVLGDTPLVSVPVPAGMHKLRLRNAEKGIDKTIEVEIQPDKHKGLRLKL
jgi:serine/threonine-protein kinase